MRVLAFLLCMIPLFASSEEIVLGMSQDEVADPVGLLNLAEG